MLQVYANWLSQCDRPPATQTGVTGQFELFPAPPIPSSPAGSASFVIRVDPCRSAVQDPARPAPTPAVWKSTFTPDRVVQSATSWPTRSQDAGPP